MARPLRIEFPGAVYHLTARGNARQDIVIDDTDRARFVDLLAREVAQQRWQCYAWCLMDNHYHLLIETPEGHLVSGMRRLNQVYTQQFNRRHGRVGHVLQGRYKSILVDKQRYLLELCRYVVLNPVRAGMTRSAREWRWSSYRATAGLAETPEWLNVDWVLGQFGRRRSAAKAAYRQFVQEGTKAPTPWHELHGQIWLGDEQFRERMAHRLKDKDIDAVPRAQTEPERPDAQTVLDAVAEVFEVSRQRLLDRSHQRAFQTSVYLLRRVVNLSLKETAALANVSPSRISRIQAAIERSAPDKAIALLLKKYNVKL
ncbi:MAG TPA: transposase [Gammaproteobacteria bacterium]|nr:transposase [Gammaproteobacteria bacterium]